MRRIRIATVVALLMLGSTASTAVADTPHDKPFGSSPQAGCVSDSHPPAGPEPGEVGDIGEDARDGVSCGERSGP